MELAGLKNRLVDAAPGPIGAALEMSAAVANDVAAALEPPLYRSLRGDLEAWIRAARSQGVDDATLAALFDHVLREIREEVPS